MYSYAIVSQAFYLMLQDGWIPRIPILKPSPAKGRVAVIDLQIQIGE